MAIDENHILISHYFISKAIIIPCLYLKLESFRCCKCNTILSIVVSYISNSEIRTRISLSIFRIRKLYYPVIFGRRNRFFIVIFFRRYSSDPIVAIISRLFCRPIIRRLTGVLKIYFSIISFSSTHF